MISAAEAIREATEQCLSADDRVYMMGQGVADPKGDDLINQVAEDGANRYGINSTPSIVIDGTLRPEMAEWTALKGELDKELAAK